MPAQILEQKDIILGAAKLALEAGAIVVENAKFILEPAIGVLNVANVSPYLIHVQVCLT